MQLRINNATVTNGDPEIVISGVLSGAEEVEAGSLVKRDGEQAIYVVGSRTPASGASLTGVTLTTNYVGSSGTGPLQIVNNFSPSRSYPLTYKGDGDPADWIRRAITMIDVDVASFIAAFPLTPGDAGGIAYSDGSKLAWSGPGTSGHVLVSGGAGAPTWAADIAGKSGLTDALKSATTTVNVSAAAAPVAGQVLIATGDSAAVWGTPSVASVANAIKSATTDVDVSAATAPTTGQVLTAVDGTHATWQDPSGGNLANDEFLTGKTSGAVDKRLIGVTPTNYVAIDRDGLGIIAGGSGGLQITSPDGTLRANGTGVATGRVLFANANSEICGDADLYFDGTNLSIGSGGAGSYPLDVYTKARAGDRWLVGNAGSPTIHASLTYAINGQAGIRSAYGIQLLANTYTSADAALTNVGTATAYHVIVPAQEAAAIGIGVRAAVSQTAALFRAEDSAGTALLDITSAGALKLYGSTSGSISFAAPAVAGAQTYTLPNGYGTTGQLLTSDGAGGLSWTTVSGGGGSGTVNSGTAGQLAYYATTGDTVSGLATPAAGQVLVSGSAPAWSASPTLTGLTLSSLNANGYLVYTDASKALVNDTVLFYRPGNGRIEMYHSLNTSTTAGMIDLNCINNTGLALHVATPGSSTTQYAARFGNLALTRDDLCIMADGKIGLGTSYSAGKFTELAHIKNAGYFAGVNAAGTASKKLIGLNSSDKVSLDGSGVGIVAGSSNIAVSNTTGNLLATALDGLYKQGSNGQKLEVKQLSELHTLAAAATSDTTIQIPAGSLLIAVDARVTTTITGPTSWQYGVSTATDRFGSGLALASGTTNTGLQDGPRYYPSATAITLAGAGGSFTGGVIRVTLHYIEITPATS